MTVQFTFEGVYYVIFHDDANFFHLAFVLLYASYFQGPDTLFHIFHYFFIIERRVPSVKGSGQQISRESTNRQPCKIFS